jgi:dihydroorotate dehydrogenase electron transfer subunit
MQRQIFTITENRPLSPEGWAMALSGDAGAITRPGQFVDIALEGRFLRRPISVCDWDSDTLTLIYKVVGTGTAQMSDLHVGDRLSRLTGLGNGYNMTRSGLRPLLIGGGVGVPPLYGLAKRLTADGKDVSVILGFNSANEIFYREEFERLGCTVYITTVDGTAGAKGFVTAPMGDIDYTHYYACGPKPMLKAVLAAAKSDGQLSLEERMGCGFGACMGCAAQMKSGMRRVCKDGPVFDREEVLWASLR